MDRLDKFGKIAVSMSVDGDGRIYLYVSGNSPILVLENDGSMACVMDIMNGQQSAEEYISVDRFCSPDDKIIFYINGNGWEKSVWFTYDAETNCERILMDKKRMHMIGALFTEDGY